MRAAVMIEPNRPLEVREPSSRPPLATEVRSLAGPCGVAPR